MKKFLVPLTMIIGILVSACGSPNCEALKKQCDACTNATGKAACETGLKTYTTVGGAAGDSSCKIVVDAKTYEAGSAVCK